MYVLFVAYTSDCGVEPYLLNCPCATRNVDDPGTVEATDKPRVNLTEVLPFLQPQPTGIDDLDENVGGIPGAHPDHPPQKNGHAANPDPMATEANPESVNTGPTSTDAYERCFKFAVWIPGILHMLHPIVGTVTERLESRRLV